MFTNLARLSRGIRLSASASCSRSLRTSAQHHLGWATSTTPSSSAVNPAEVEAMQCLEEGTQKLEDGDVQAAKDLYKRSVDIKRTASGLFNLGVTHYHLKEYDDAIACWKESIALQPSSPDAHTNLASAYIVSPVSRPDLALHHLRVASSLAPEDGEIAFNLAAVLEACGHLEESLEQYQKSKDFGVDRAAMHMRNVSAKILGKKLKEAEAQQGKDEPST
ncbi:TPR-like protein [Lentinus tigrinus ALCF2SS1-7]|uniref:TPR-like protein n=1 Tax=Lentinus tigrinus ALCF2SS1-7 TaxID=1328758 RepID=UPI001166075D|nr:TPR-like protein [Lentinus tigrinus ALCF2SS1-7]